MARYMVDGSRIILVLTRLEARGLRALAAEGAEGLLTDRNAAQDYVGGPHRQKAARDALHALNMAVAPPIHPKE